MLPTWRDAEIQSEIRKTRVQEANARQILNHLPGSGEQQLSAYDHALIHLGDWMVHAGEQLRSRCDESGQLEPRLRSAEQGC